MKILFLVLFFLFTSLSCKQNPRNMLSSPPKIEEEITNNNTGSSNTNSGSNNDLNSGYGYYDVYILENGTDIKTVKYRISDTDKLLEAYSNMIIDSGSKKARFKLSKGDTETYTFDLNLDLKVEKNTAGTAKDKKFRGVCIVRIYPDATTTTANSSLLGNYTIAGIYTEMEGNNTAGNGIRKAMTKSDKFSNTGYDELIILRTDKLTDAAKNTYRADILFNDDEGIPLYIYDPDRIFKNQNTDYSFVKATP